MWVIVIEINYAEKQIEEALEDSSEAFRLPEFLWKEKLVRCFEL